MARIIHWRGKWAVDYRDSAGRRHRPSFETKREAEEFFGDAVREARQAVRCIVDPDVTLAVYVDRWMRQVAANAKPRTVEVYEKNLRLHILPVLGHRKVRQLYRGIIKEHLVQKLGEGLHRNTVRLIHAVLRSVLNGAVDDGVILANPADKLGRQLRLVASKSAKQEEVKAFTREQLVRFLDASREVAARYYPLFFTLARSGLRLGEARGLQWADLDLDLTKRTMRIARTM